MAGDKPEIKNESGNHEFGKQLESLYDEVKGLTDKLKSVGKMLKSPISRDKFKEAFKKFFDKKGVSIKETQDGGFSLVIDETQEEKLDGLKVELKKLALDVQGKKIRADFDGDGKEDFDGEGDEESAEKQKLTFDDFGRFYKSGTIENGESKQTEIWQFGSNIKSINYNGYKKFSTHTGENIRISARNLHHQGGDGIFSKKILISYGEGDDKKTAILVMGETPKGEANNIDTNKDFKSLDEIKQYISSNTKGLEAWLGDVKPQKQGEVSQALDVYEVGDAGVHESITINISDMSNNKDNPLHLVKDGSDYNYIYSDSEGKNNTLKFDKDMQDKIKSMYEIKDGKLKPKQGAQPLRLDVAGMQFGSEGMYMMMENLDFDGQNKFDTTFRVNNKEEGDKKYLEITAVEIDQEKRQETDLGLGNGLKFDKMGFLYNSSLIRKIDNIKDNKQKLVFKGLLGFENVDGELSFDEGSADKKRLKSLKIGSLNNTFDISDLDMELDASDHTKVAEFYNTLSSRIIRTLDMITMAQSGIMSKPQGFDFNKEEGKIKLSYSALEQEYNKDPQKYMKAYHDKLRSGEINPNKYWRYFGYRKISEDNTDWSKLDYKMLRGNADFTDYMPWIQEAQEKFGIPQSLLVNLFINEGSRGQLSRKNPYSSAIGLGQILDSTWRGIKGRCLDMLDIDGGYKSELRGFLMDRDQMISKAQEGDMNKGGDVWKNVGRQQVLATAIYLRYLYEEHAGEQWGDAMVYYHTGPGFLSRAKSDPSWFKKVMDSNPAVKVLMQGNLPEDYVKAAQAYYKQNAGIA